jgi:hypothetical protein
MYGSLSYGQYNDQTSGSENIFFSDSISMSEKITKKTSRNLNEIMASIESIIHCRWCTFLERISATDVNYFDSSSMGAIILGENMFGGNPTYILLFQRIITRNILESSSLIEIISKKFTRAFLESISTIESFFKKTILNLSELLTTLDHLLRPGFLYLYDTFDSAEVIARKITRKLLDLPTLTEIFRKYQIRHLYDSIFSNDRGEDYPYLGGNYFGSLSLGGDNAFNPLYFSIKYLPYFRPEYKTNNLVVSAGNNQVAVSVKNGIITVRVKDNKLYGGIK